MKNRPMTRKKAIEILVTATSSDERPMTDKQIQARHMIIDALIQMSKISERHFYCPNCGTRMEEER